MRQALLAELKKAYQQAREQARELLFADGSGLACAARLSRLQDQIDHGAARFRAEPRLQRGNGSPEAARIAVTAVGGYGRGTLAPGSDIDLLFLLPAKPPPWGEPAIEFMLYMLWDMGFKVGHATRNIEECIALSKADMTIRTAILEAALHLRLAALFDELAVRFEREIMRGTGPEFIAAKLAERDERHRKAGDTRYLVEPNVKEGKGGLRDLHTLFWIAKYYLPRPRPGGSGEARRPVAPRIQAVPEGRGFPLGRALPHAFPDRQGGGAAVLRHPVARSPPASATSRIPACRPSSAS